MIRLKIQLANSKHPYKAECSNRSLTMLPREKGNWRSTVNVMYFFPAAGAAIGTDDIFVCQLSAIIFERMVEKWYLTNTHTCS